MNSKFWLALTLVFLLSVTVVNAGVPAVPSNRGSGPTLYDVVLNGQTINRWKVENCNVILQPVLLPGASSGAYNWLHIPLQGVTYTVDRWGAGENERSITLHAGVFTAHNQDCGPTYTGR